MTGTLEFILDFIRLDILLAFGYYSILFFVVRLFLRQKDFINEFDQSTCRLIVHAGLVWGIFWILSMVNFYIVDPESYLRFAPFWWGIWFEPIFWVLLTQLLRFKLFRKLLIYRVVMSLLFVLTVERFVIIVTSLHRDYLPSSWSPTSSFNIGLSTGEIIIGLLAKIISFMLIASVYHFGKRKIKMLYKNE